MKNVLKRHRSKIIIILLSSILLGCSQEKMILKKEKFVVEYGQSISTKVSDYLDNKDNFLKDVKMTVDGQNEEGKTYQSIGQYKVSFTRNQKTVETTVEIVHTTAPEFKDLKESYKSLTESIIHAGASLDTRVNLKWCDSERIDENNVGEIFKDCSGILVAGGFGGRGVECMICSAK